MTKSNKILIGLLIAQLAFILVANVATRSRRVAAPQALFPQVKSDEITAIDVIDHDKKSARLEKRGKEWVLASADGYPVQADKVSEFIGKIPTLMSNQIVANKPTYFHALEVSDDNFQRNVTLTAGDKTIQFLLGSSPGIKSTHLRFVGENDVYLVKGISAWDVGTSATMWAKNDYFKVNKDDVTAITLENSHGTLQFSKDAEGKWQVSPLPETATPESVNTAALQSFVNSSSSVFLQDPVGKEIKRAYGLSEPSARLTIVVHPSAKEGAEPVSDMTYTISIGGKIPDNDGVKYYAKASTSDFVVLIGSWAAEQFINKKPADFIKADPQLPSGHPAVPGMPSMLD